MPCFKFLFCRILIQAATPLPPALASPGFCILETSSASCIPQASLHPKFRVFVTFGCYLTFFRTRTPLAHCRWKLFPGCVRRQLLEPATTHCCFLSLVAAEDSHQTTAPPAFCQKFVHLHILIYPQSVFPCTAMRMSYSICMQRSSRHLVKFINCQSSRWNGNFSIVLVLCLSFKLVDRPCCELDRRHPLPIHAQPYLGCLELEELLGHLLAVHLRVAIAWRDAKSFHGFVTPFCFQCMVRLHATRLSLAWTIIPSIPFKGSASGSSSIARPPTKRAQWLCCLPHSPPNTFAPRNLKPLPGNTRAAPRTLHPIWIKCIFFTIHNVFFSIFYSAAFAPSHCFSTLCL